MREIIDENFIQSLVNIARGYVRGKDDPYELVNGAVDYLLSNEERYMDHPNIKAIAVLKMKGLLIDNIRKNEKFSTMTDDEGKTIDIEDKKEDISEKISLSDECKKVLSTIKKMSDNCREILMLRSEDMSMQEMQEITGVKSVGTILSRLSTCRKKLKGLLGS